MYHIHLQHGVWVKLLEWRGRAGQAGQAGWREAEQQQQPGQGQVGRHTGQSEPEPAGEVERLARQGGEVVQQDEVGRRSDHGPGPADVSRVGNTALTDQK